MGVVSSRVEDVFLSKMGFIGRHARRELERQGEGRFIVL
jgi:hypothetical protein